VEYLSQCGRVFNQLLGILQYDLWEKWKPCPLESPLSLVLGFFFFCFYFKRSGSHFLPLFLPRTLPPSHTHFLSLTLSLLYFTYSLTFSHLISLTYYLSLSHLLSLSLSLTHSLTLTLPLSLSLSFLQCISSSLSFHARTRTYTQSSCLFFTKLPFFHNSLSLFSSLSFSILALFVSLFFMLFCLSFSLWLCFQLHIFVAFISFIFIFISL